MDKDNKKVKDKITISITPELHSALFMKALEDRTSISQIIENTLKDAEEIKNIYLPKVIEYSKDEKEIELTAASPHSLERNRNTPRVITFLHEEDPEPHSQTKEK